MDSEKTERYSSFVIPLPLQRLPDGPDAVHASVVEEEDRVEGGVVQTAHGILATSSQPQVHGVVRDFELDLKVAEGGLLQGQQHVVQEVVVVEQIRLGVT